MAYSLRDAAGRFSSSKFEGERLLDDVSASLLRAAKKEAPRKTGKLADTLRVERSDEGRHITSDAPYLPFVVRGTRAHDIQARAGGVLAFAVGGRTIFARRVRHPGTQPNDFFASAIAQATPDFERALAKAGDDFLKDLLP